jgi:hypothetical protein
MSERRPEEKLVAATITTTLGLKVTQHDDGKQPSMHDLNIVAADGTFADVEDVAPKAGDTGATAAAREGPQGEPPTAISRGPEKSAAGVPQGIVVPSELTRGPSAVGSYPPSASRGHGPFSPKPRSSQDHVLLPPQVRRAKKPRAVHADCRFGSACVATEREGDRKVETGVTD